ncbi:MAG: transposase [Chloroflexota bacterium]|nr:transposase [Chloroflexota bacterium]
MVATTWLMLPKKYAEITLDSFVLMPNHFHGLVTFDSEDVEGNASLSEAMKWFKAMTTNWYMQGVTTSGWPRFDRHLWQRSFHDRIVRSDSEMNRFRTYIANNAALWTKDTFFEP